MVGAAILSEAQDIRMYSNSNSLTKGREAGNGWASSVRGDTCHTGRPWL